MDREAGTPAQAATGLHGWAGAFALAVRAALPGVQVHLMAHGAGSGIGARRQLAPAGAMAASLLLVACVFVPRQTTSFDEECGVETRHMTLEHSQVAVLTGCAGDACAGLLVVYGAVTAGSLVVSGSITVVGNVVYWVQHQAQCLPLRHAGTAPQS